MDQRIERKFQKWGIVTIVILLVIIATLKLIPIEDEKYHYDYNVSSHEPSYTVRIYTDTTRPIENVQFQLIHQGGSTVIAYDPQNNSVPLEGNLSDIEYDSHKRLKGRLCHWKNASLDSYYADFPDGSNNITLFIIFKDVRDDGLFNDNDFFEVRWPATYGGKNEIMYLKIFDRDKGITIYSIKLDKTPIVPKFDVNITDGDYQITLNRISPIKMDEPYRLFGSVLDYENHAGSISDIIFNESNYQKAVNSPWMNATYNDLFYADYPNGTNITLSLVIQDKNQNMLLDKGDVINLRNPENGGILLSQFSLKISNFFFKDIRDFDIEWTISIINDTYCINISQGMVGLPNFAVLDTHNQIVSINDSEHRAELMGYVYHLEFDQDEYDEAVDNPFFETYGDLFYSLEEYRDPYDGELKHRLYIVYENVDQDYNLSIGDRIWIRSSFVGGLVNSGYKLVLWQETYGWTYRYQTGHVRIELE